MGSSTWRVPCWPLRGVRIGRGPGRRAAPAILLAGAIFAGVVPSVRAALPDNSWLGLRSADPADGVMATCSLAAGGTNSVWAAVTGTASLDIIQIGAQHTSTGDRLFGAWGHGEPGTGAYSEIDLGPTDSLAHRYTVRLTGTTWSLSVDGHTRLTVPDADRTWSIRAEQVQNEVTSAEPMGPAACHRALVHRSGAWAIATWSFTGAGQSAAAASTQQGPAWFQVAP